MTAHEKDYCNEVGPCRLGICFLRANFAYVGRGCCCDVPKATRCRGRKRKRFRTPCSRGHSPHRNLGGSGFRIPEGLFLRLGEIWTLALRQQ